MIKEIYRTGGIIAFALLISAFSSEPSYAACAACVFPILAAAGAAAAGAGTIWLLCFWFGASVYMLALWGLKKAHVRIHYMDAMIITSFLTLAACIIYAGEALRRSEILLYTEAGIAAASLSLSVHCIMKAVSSVKIPYLRPITVNSILFLSGIGIYLLPERMTGRAAFISGQTFIFTAALLYILRCCLLHRKVDS